MINSIDAIKQQNIYRVNAVNLFENDRFGNRSANIFNSGLFTAQDNNNYNPNHPMIKGSATQARHLDLLA